MSVFPPGQTVDTFGGNFDRFPVNLGDESHVVERAAIRQIFQHIEEECQRQEEVWLHRDKEFCAAMGIPFAQSRIERVQHQNFFVGARPSLVSTSIDFWPSVTARVGPGRASSEQFDQFDVMDMDLFIEVLCKFGPVRPEELFKQAGIDAEGEVNKQVQRLSAAVQMCVSRDRTLGAIVQPIQRPPAKTPSFPFAVSGDDEEGTGDSWLYMGKQLRYIVQANTL